MNEIVDQDELQLKDELNKPWVKAWKNAVKPEPWKGICCKRCYYAKGKRCTCKCKGSHHGEGRKLKEMEGENRFPLLGWKKT